MSLPKDFKPNEKSRYKKREKKFCCMMELHKWELRGDDFYCKYWGAYNDDGASIGSAA